MDFNKAQSIFETIKNGQTINVELLTSQNSRLNANAKKSGYSVKKHSFTICRKGVEYSNTNYIDTICKELNYVVGERITSTKDAQNKGYADSTTGNKLVDLFSMYCKADRAEGRKPINAPKAEYYVTDPNGVETIVDFEELKSLSIMQPAYFTQSAKDKEKYDKMLLMRTAWEQDKANYPQADKDILAKLIRDLYNKMFTPNVENILSINGIK